MIKECFKYAIKHLRRVNLKLNKHFNGFFDKISSDQGLFRVRSRDQGKISSIKNLDPGRGWFYSPYESD